MDHFEIVVRNPNDFGNRLLFYKQGKKLCDVNIIVNRQRISAHAIVLSASSEYFENETIFSKSIPDQFPFHNVDTEAFLLLIDYCYTGSIKITDKNVKDVLKIANILLMTPVIESCTKMLEKRLNFNNCLSTWTFAKTEYLEYLQLLTYEFCKRNFKEASQSQEFLNLTYSEVDELLSSDINVEYEKIVYDSVKNWINHNKIERMNDLNDLLKHVKLPYLPRETLLNESQFFCRTNTECQNNFLKALQWQLTNGSYEGIDSSAKIPRDSYVTLISVGADTVTEAGTMNLYDVSRQEWVQIKDIGCNRMRFSSLLVEDKFMLIGGLENNSPVNTINEYDLKSGQMRTLPPMKYSRYVPAVVLFSDFVYVIGGLNRQALFVVEKWDPKTKTWSDVAPMLTPRIGCRAIVLGKEIFVLGGLSHNSNYLNETETYNPETNKWKKCASMIEKRYAPGAAVIGKYLYVVCGRRANDIEVMSAERYDPEIDKWTTIQSTGINRYWTEAGNLMGKLVIYGGFTDGANFTKLDTVQVYDEDNNKWVSMVSLKSPSAMSKAIEIPWGLAKLVLPRKTA